MQFRSEGLSRRLEALIEKLPEEKRSPLRELLMSLLEPVQKMRLQRDSLERLEERYLLALQEDSNVVNFRRSDPPEVARPPAKGDRRWQLKVPCMIEAPTGGEIFRMAFELHLRSSRSIFLSWHDIEPAGRQNPKVLLELLSCTIFIPDAAKLPAAEQITILEVIRKSAFEKPEFMAGTHLPYSELVKDSGLNKDYLEAISQAYLKLTKPVAQYKREGLIRYFLESLS